MLNWTTLTLAQAEGGDSLPPNLPAGNNPGQAPAAPAGGDTGATTGATTGADPNAQPTPAAPGGGMLQILMLAFIPALILMIFFSNRKQKKQQAERQALIDAIKKGDKVQTIGGIRGTVAEVHDDEIIVKVDENSNTRMRFVRNAVSTVLDSKSKDK